MANYRFYVLDKDDHVRESPQVFECRSDEVAVEKAVQLLNNEPPLFRIPRFKTQRSNPASCSRR